MRTVTGTRTMTVVAMAVANEEVMAVAKAAVTVVVVMVLTFKRRKPIKVTDYFSHQRTTTKTTLKTKKTCALWRKSF